MSAPNPSRPLGVVVTLSAILLAVATPAARANFVLVSQQLTINRSSDIVSFDLVFNQKPDFRTVDVLGRPANSFQIEFAGDPLRDGLPFPQNLTAIVRGDEIHLANAIRIRQPTGDGGPGSGGWGPVIAAEPFKLDQNKLSFSTSLEDLGVRGPTFQYNAFSLEFGSLTAIQEVHLVPTPLAVEMFAPAGALAVIAIVRMRRRVASHV